MSAPDHSCATNLPWRGEFRVVTLLEMRNHYAFSLYLTGVLTYGMTIRTSCKKEANHKLLPRAKRDAITESLESLVYECKRLDLPVSLSTAERLMAAIPKLTYAEARVLCLELHEHVVQELQSVMFLTIDSRKAQYFETVCPFGEEVMRRFWSAEYDVREAALCFAVGRYTATVMHCMRVLEVGLRALAAAIGAKLPTRGWGSVLNACDSAWQRRLKTGPRLSPWKRTFFPQAFAEFRYFADAWRNHSMHARAKYGEQEASQVFEHTRTFMQHLATRLREPKRTKRP